MDLPTPNVPSLDTVRRGASLVRLSIFWRIVLTSLLIIVVMAGVNFYALFQLRQLCAMSTTLVPQHYPAIEQAKHVQAVGFNQLNSEKKYLAVRDPTFLQHFDEEAEEYHRGIENLLRQETSSEGRQILEQAKRFQQDRLSLFHSELEHTAATPGSLSPDYEARRNEVMDHMTATLDHYVDFLEAAISAGVSRSRESSAQAEAITEQLVLLALLFGIGLAGIASYTILRPLRQLQAHIKQIGQGNFKASLNIRAPSELRDLVDTVNWMGGKLQELDDMKGEFLAHVSHELRTPMASIQEGTHLLLDEIPGPLSQEQRTTLRIMADSSRRLITLISTILDLSKMEAGMMEYRIVPTDLKRVTDMSVNKIRLLADAKHVQLVVEAPAQRVWVKADAIRIEQVLDNLLSNALKFSPEGGIVKTQMKADQKAGVLEVAVSDVGPGIPADELPHIFERFYQGSTKSKHSTPGSGLGLALAKKVVEAHGGRIWIESEVKKGTPVRVFRRIPKPGSSE